MQYNPFHITVPNNLCDKIIKDNESLDIIEGTIESKDKNKRSSKISWVPQNKFPKEIKSYINTANKMYNFSLKEFESLQYSRYKEGDHYNWHIDTHSKPYRNGMIRKLSFTLCLNDEFEGGEFDICNPDPRETKNTIKSFKLKKGDMIVFPSHTWHRVNPVTKGTRKSLVGWALGPQWL